jgi:hypothetical protein
MPSRVGRPEPDEYAGFYARYVEAIPLEREAIDVMEGQAAAIDMLGRLSPEQAAHRYAPGKWSVRQVVGHLADVELIFSYRLLRIARGDATPLPGFDENAFVDAAPFEAQPIAELAGYLQSARGATLAIVRGLDERVMARRGMVNDHLVSARALAYVSAGHLAHHLALLRDRYQLDLPSA